jgi:hypothetical protein
MRRDERRHPGRVEAMDDRRISVEDQGLSLATAARISPDDRRSATSVATRRREACSPATHWRSSRLETDVVRDGAETAIPIARVVRGDIVVLRAGDVVPADCGVVDERSLHMNFIDRRRTERAEMFTGRAPASGG